MNWQPPETAPKDGTWILGMNNRGNPAVIIWCEKCWDTGYPGWIHPFTDGKASSFWNGACGSVLVAWCEIGKEDRLKACEGKLV